MFVRIVSPIAMLATCLVTGVGQAGQPLETETARFGKKGAVAVELGMEGHTSSAGSELALPFALEYSLSNRTELLVEPVPYTAIHNRGGPRITGVGDLEVTLSTLLAAESRFPAIALAGEVKFPTARNNLIGSGKTDLAGYLILSKRTGRLDTHFNIGYTLVGKPDNLKVSNTYNLALAGEYMLSGRFDAVAEALYTSAAIPDAGEGGGGGGESILAPEIGGDELLGMLGARFRPGDTGPVISLGMTWDNNNAFLVRPGVTFKFQ